MSPSFKPSGSAGPAGCRAAPERDAIDHNYSAPPPTRNTEGFPPHQQNPGQQYTGLGAPQHEPPQQPQDSKALFIVLGVVAAVVIAAVVAVFIWAVPAFTP
ncbi:hypothetical protein, partial [Escherichia coli]|uniref:hypothetical protein n=1 Tax=Escherichia coli TaxID=562 RepID=UPI0032E4441F